MADEGFEESDFEHAVLTARIVRRQRDHIGRRKYTLEGVAQDRRPLGVVCRFSDAGESIVVITIFGVTD